MKKHILLAIILLTHFANRADAQNELPNSHVNVGAGFGMPYGGIGTKTVLGYRNSGLLIGLGYMPTGFVGYEFGAQVSADWFYINLGYGVSGTYQVNDEPAKSVKAGNIMVGGMINLNRQRNFFLDLSIGHTIAAPTVKIGPFEEDQGGFTLALGLGIRVANKKE